MKDQRNFKMLSAIGGIGEDIVDEAKAVRRVCHRPRVLIAAAVMLGLLTVLLVTSVAATYDIGFYVSQIFGGNVEMLNEMTAKPGRVFKTSTNDDVKFEVVGITGDRFNAYVWLNVTLPEELDMKDKMLWFSNWSVVKGGSVFGHDSFGSSYGYFENIGNNVYKTFVLVNSNKPLAGNRIRIQFEDLCVLRQGEIMHPDNYDVKLEGKWTLSFGLNYADLTQVYTPDVKGTVLHIPEDTPVSVPPHHMDKVVYDIPVETCEVHISPISVKLGFAAEGDIFPAGHPQQVRLILDNGEAVDAILGSGGSQYSAENGYSFDSTAHLSEPIDPERVAAVEYCGLTIPLK